MGHTRSAVTGIRTPDKCKIKWYLAEYVVTRRCGYCKGEGELFQRDANFWGGGAGGDSNY